MYKNSDCHNLISGNRDQFNLNNEKILYYSYITASHVVQ